MCIYSLLFIFATYSQQRYNKVSNNETPERVKKTEKDMKEKRYFLYGKEISEQEANEIERRNQEYLDEHIRTGNWDVLNKIDFVTVLK